MQIVVESAQKKSRSVSRSCVVVLSKNFIAVPHAGFMTAKAWRYLTLLLGARQEEEPARLTVHQLRKEKEGLLAPTNVTSDDARKRQFGVAVFHEPRMNSQAHGIPLKHFTREYTGVSFIFPQGRR